MFNANSKSRLSRLNSRQRKKQRVGEFTELGFMLAMSFQEDLSHEDQDALLTEWLDLVDQHKVSFGGHFDGASDLDGMVFPISPVKVSEEIRTQLLAWVESKPAIVSFEASELMDIWHAA